MMNTNSRLPTRPTRVQRHLGDVVTDRPDRPDRAQGERSITSRDVARLAGVSQATVSRVINDSTNVTPALRERVHWALEQTGYRPNAMAQAMKTGRTGTIGVVIARITNPFYPELLNAIGRRLAASDHRMILWETEFAGEDSAIEAIRQGLVDGVLFTTAMPGQPAVTEAIRREAPMVLVNRTIADLPCDQLSSDNVDGSAQATRYLLEAGHERLGFIAGTPRASTAEERMEGVRRVMAAHGEPEDLRIVPGDFSHRAGRNGLERLLDSDHPPTAILSVNDVTAIGVLDAARARGLDVPGQMAVIGFDDIEMASWSSFDLTTVRQPTAEMADTAVQLLLTRVGGERGEAEHRRFPCELVARSTT